MMEDDLRWKTTFIGSLDAAYSALRHFSISGSDVTDVMVGLTQKRKYSPQIRQSPYFIFINYKLVKMLAK